MIERGEQREIQQAQDDLNLACVRALGFVAAALGPVPDNTIKIDDPWRIALLRVVNCLDLGAPNLARKILVRSLTGMQGPWRRDGVPCQTKRILPGSEQ